MKHNGPEWEKIYRLSDRVVTRKIADETILVPVSGNLANMQRIFTVNEVGEAIWELMDGTRSVREIRNKLLKEFDVEEDRLDKDIWEFVERLKQSELILE